MRLEVFKIIFLFSLIGFSQKKVEGTIFLILSLIVSFSSSELNYFDDKLNLIFLLGCLSLIFSSFINFLDPESINNISQDSYCDDAAQLSTAAVDDDDDDHDADDDADDDDDDDDDHDDEDHDDDDEDDNYDDDHDDKKKK